MLIRISLDEPAASCQSGSTAPGLIASWQVCYQNELCDWPAFFLRTLSSINEHLDFATTRNSSLYLQAN